MRIDRPDRMQLYFLVAVALLAIGFAIRSGSAHEIPVDARLNVFVVPSGNTLSLLVRLPLGAMGDIDYPTRPGNSVAVSQADPALHDASTLWIIPAIDVFENDRLLPAPRIVAARISLPSDRSFESWTTARASMERPKLDDSLDLYWSQQMLDVLLEYPIGSDRSNFAVDLRVDRFGQAVTTALRFIPPGSDGRAFESHGNSGLMHLDPSWLQAASRFVQEGIWHILTGTDHLLFLACLVIPFRRIRPLVAIVTAFTVAHSIALFASALGFAPDMLWFPPLVETLIATSIFYMALENIIGCDVRRRWVLTFAFGLVHGFGFSFGLREVLQFAGSHLITSLFAFNLGVEIGQILVLIVLVPVLQFALSRLPSEHTGIIVLSAIIAHQAWHWMTDRWEILTKFPFPKLDIVLLTSAMRGAMAVLILGGAVWIVSGALNRWLGQESERTGDPST